MKSNESVVKISWILYGTLLLLEIVTIIYTFYHLHKGIPLEIWGSDSKIETSNNDIGSIAAVIFIGLVILLVTFWNRIKPFHVAYITLLTGLIYLLIFAFLTTGWVQLQGILGLIVAFCVSVFMIVLLLFQKWVRYRKRKK